MPLLLLLLLLPESETTRPTAGKTAADERVFSMREHAIREAAEASVKSTIGDPEGRAGAPNTGGDPDVAGAPFTAGPRNTGFGRERTSADETMGLTATAMSGARMAAVVVVVVVTGAAAAAAVVAIGAAAAAVAVVVGATAAAAVVAGGAAAAAAASPLPALKRRTGRSWSWSRASNTMPLASRRVTKRAARCF